MVFSLSVLLLLVAVSMAQEKRFRESIEPLLADYCYDCHGDGSDKGDVQLDAFSSYDVLVKDKRFWKRVWENLHSQTMPPAQKSHPTDSERERLLSWIEREVFKFDPSVPDPGRVTIRRLNRVEYDNAIRDLTGVDFQPAKDFPPDDTGYGFDTVGDALSLSPLLLEKYLAAADKILDRALGKNSPRAKPGRYSSREMIGDGYAKDERVLSKTGEVKVSFKVPISGLYRFRASAWATRAGTELAKMRFRVNDHQLRIFEVAQEPPGEKVYEAVLEAWKAGEEAPTTTKTEPKPTPRRPTSMSSRFRDRQARASRMGAATMTEEAETKLKESIRNAIKRALDEQKRS